MQGPHKTMGCLGGLAHGLKIICKDLLNHGSILAMALPSMLTMGPRTIKLCTIGFDPSNDNSLFF